METAIKEILADIFNLEGNVIDENFTPQNVELWDSLNHLRMITAIENQFKVTLTMEEISQMNSYNAIVETVHKHVQEQ